MRIVQSLILLFSFFILIASILKLTNKNTHNENKPSTTEIRAYIQNINSIKNALIDLGATFKSEYAFTDYIYQPKETHWNLNKEFIRLRVYEKTNWDQKKCVLVHKMKKTPGITGKLLIHKEFDEITQAQQEVKDDYAFMFSFYRKGWQYSLHGSQIFIEDIENLNPTIEIVASDKDHIDDLFTKLSITDLIEYSVPYLIQQKKSAI